LARVSHASDALSCPTRRTTSGSSPRSWAATPRPGCARAAVSPPRSAWARGWSVWGRSPSPSTPPPSTPWRAPGRRGSGRTDCPTSSGRRGSACGASTGATTPRASTCDCARGRGASRGAGAPPRGSPCCSGPLPAERGSGGATSRPGGATMVIMLGVDGLASTRGIDVRLRALEELLEEGRLATSEITLLQLATPSRERVEQYQIMRARIEEAVGRINGRFGEIGHPVVTYIHRPVPKSGLTAFYAAADVMLVTPVRDGMNHVAKEYVASCTDGDGALVLSEYAGAATELRHAYLCNPHDLNGV